MIIGIITGALAACLPLCGSEKKIYMIIDLALILIYYYYFLNKDGTATFIK
jgi:hypothetical protein